MKIGQIIRDFFAGPEGAFQKLQNPDYFSRERANLASSEEYAKWLKKTYSYYGSMAYAQKERGRKIPEHWIEAIKKIEAEMERFGQEEGMGIFSKEQKKISEDFEAIVG